MLSHRTAESLEIRKKRGIGSSIPIWPNNLTLAMCCLIKSWSILKWKERKKDQIKIKLNALQRKENQSLKSCEIFLSVGKIEQLDRDSESTLSPSNAILLFWQLKYSIGIHWVTRWPLCYTAKKNLLTNFTIIMSFLNNPYFCFPHSFLFKFLLMDPILKLVFKF